MKNTVDNLFMNKKSKCPDCGYIMRKVNPKRPYLYTASGLDNIKLTGIEVYECNCGGGAMAWIPKIGQLHRAIAIELLKKPASLEGKELVFLRKHFRLKATELAEKLRVTKQTVSQWENDVIPMGLANDRLVRIFFMLSFIDELNKTRVFAEAGRTILNEKSLSELRNIFELPVKRKKKFSLNIDEVKLRTNLDPFEPVTV